MIFTGCAKTISDYNALRNSPHQAVKNFSTLISKKINNDEELIVKLGNEDTEIIKLDSQRVFASKLLLPKATRPFSIDVFSSSEAGFFAPKILFLDKNNKIVKTVSAKDLNFDRGFFKGSIFVNKKYDGIKSLIVTQDLNELNSSHKVSSVSTTPMYIPVGSYMMTYVTSSSDQNRTFMNAYGGNVKLLLKVYNPTILGSK